VALKFSNETISKITDLLLARFSSFELYILPIYYDSEFVYADIIPRFFNENFTENYL